MRGWKEAMDVSTATGGQRTRKKVTQMMAKMVARLGRANPAVPMESKALPMTL